MPDMHDCLEVFIKSGELPAVQARKAQVAYARLRARYGSPAPAGTGLIDAPIRQGIVRFPRTRGDRPADALADMKRLAVPPHPRG